MGKLCVLSVWVRLPKRHAKTAPATGEKVAAPSQQAADAEGIGWDDVSTHCAIALLNPPANGSLAGVIGAIQLLLVGATPLAIACQAAPQIPAIQKQETEPIGQTGRRPFLRRSGL